MTVRTTFLSQINLGRGLVGVSQQEVDPLLLPSLDRHYEANSRGEDISKLQPTLSSSLNTGSHNKSSHGGSCLKTSNRDLRRSEQLRLHTYHRVVDSVEDSDLCVEMGALESQEEDVPKRILWYKPLGILGVIRPHH